MKNKNTHWPLSLGRNIRNGLPLTWPQEWSRERNHCIECSHPSAEHRIIAGGDNIYRVFCRICPPSRTRLMGDEGLYGPVPYFIEGPLSQVPCFEEQKEAGKVDNFLPLSPSSQGVTTFTLKAMTPDGGEADPITFAGLSWHPQEFERLAVGDEIDRGSQGYKLQLYWSQEGRCAACLRLTYFDQIEVDRIIPSDDGPGYSVGNVQLLCSSCNKIKGKKSSMDDLMGKLMARGLPRNFDQADVRD